MYNKYKNLSVCILRKNGKNCARCEMPPVSAGVAIVDFIKSRQRYFITGFNLFYLCTFVLFFFFCSFAPSVTTISRFFSIQII